MKKKDLKAIFLKIKQDMISMQKEVKVLRLDVNHLTNKFKFSENFKTNKGFNANFLDTTNDEKIPTNSVITTDTTTVPWEIGGLKAPNLRVSTGNRGVTTDRQTDRQTDQQTDKILINNIDYKKNKNSLNIIKETKNIEDMELNIQRASEILESLDKIKKDIRLKFKKVTPREMIVFSLIYQLENQGFREITYNHIAKTLKLSQSSIRDYIQRMIRKGIPIKKVKINNKQIFLFISEDLKKIASLSTIIKLRDL